MSYAEDFLTASDEQEIIEAIREAERNTSGEIRIHIEDDTREDVFMHATEIFHQLKMDNTQDRNGVLIYIAVKSKAFVILGDQGIDKVVPVDFWDTTRDLIQSYFRKGQFKQGIVEGVLKAGTQLKNYFPWSTDDINELPDDISRG